MLRKITKHFHTAFDQIRDPLLLVDETGKILSYNAAAHASLDLGNGTVDAVRSLERTYSIEPGQLMTLIHRGASIYGREMVDEAGNASDAVFDVTDLGVKHRGHALKLIHIRDFSSYRNYERWKDELVAMVSHEVKNPLAAMKNSMNLLITQAAGPVTDDQHKLVTTAIRNIDRLTRMLDTFLDVSRIGAGSYVAEPAWVDARKFLGTVTTSFKTLFNVQRQELTYDVSDEVDRIFVDAYKLEQVIINLLTNATKYTPEGGKIEVTIEPAGLDALDPEMRLVSWRELANLRFFRVRVRDTGIGMDAQTLNHLFTRYYDDERNNARGSHLGLSISKRLVEVLGGSLVVDSSLGVGTEVSVTLPQDAHTSTVIANIEAANRALSRVTPAVGATFFVCRKGSEESWDEHIGRWPATPQVNPNHVPTDSGLAVWTLGEQTAVVLNTGGDNASFEDIFGAADIGRHDWTIHDDGYAVARCRVPQDGVRATQLLRTAIARISDRVLQDASV